MNISLCRDVKHQEGRKGTSQLVICKMHSQINAKGKLRIVYYINW